MEQLQDYIWQSKICKNVFPLTVSKNNVDSHKAIWNLLDKTFQRSKFSLFPLSLFSNTFIFIHRLNVLDFEIQLYNIPILLLISHFQNM